MKILAIETSCDDTGIAIVEISPKSGDFKVLSNIISSQVEIHKKYGGVYPMMAKREHQRNLLPTLIRALKESKLLKISNSKFLISNQIPNSKSQILKSILEREPNFFKNLINFLKKYQKPDIDLIAVTVGPGLEPCLWVGVNFAKALSYYWNIPTIPVNHIEAHILVNFLDKFQASSFKFQELFPAVCLVVSGGHTQLILMKAPASAKATAGKVGKYKILGETRDDAAGECFDKTARILGLGYPGGPAIAAAAAKFQVSSFRFQVKLPRPMINTKDYDFSFSGLKTAVLYLNQKSKIKNQKYKQEMAREIQQAIIDVLIRKTLKAAKDFGAKSIILGGGVAANNELRKQFAEKIQHLTPNTQYLTPNTKFCTDNAAMIGVAGYFNWLKKKTKNWKNIEVSANLRIK